jgi:hypothetical protein
LSLFLYLLPARLLEREDMLPLRAVTMQEQEREGNSQREIVVLAAGATGFRQELLAEVEAVDCPLATSVGNEP